MYFCVRFYGKVFNQNMNTLLEQIAKYFETRSDEEIFRDWKSLEKYSSVGISVDDFIEHVKQTSSIEEFIFRWQNEQNFKNKIESPAFLSDFFLYLQTKNYEL